MISGRRRNRKQNTLSAAAYRKAFVGRVHQLLHLATSHANFKTFKSYHETAITGVIVRLMEGIFDDPASPRWVRHLHVQDDPPVNANGRLGRSRKRLDIRVISAQRQPRSRFSFEAKRLGHRNPVSDYLGADGLGCFLAGDYAAEEPDAGMLGYVQAGKLDVWARKISADIASGAEHLGLIAGHDWKRTPFRGGPTYTYRTRHQRRSVGHRLDVYHTLLLCC